MGNQHSQNVDRLKSDEIMENYRILQKLDDLRFGDATLIQDNVLMKSKEEYLLKELTTADEDDFNRCLTELDKKKGFRHSNLVQLLGYTTRTKSALCGTNYKILAVYEYCNWNLKKDIMARCPEALPRQPYSELELLQLAFDLIESGCYLQQKKIIHGDIRPQTILQTKGSKITKINDHVLYKQTEPYMEILTNSDYSPKGIYISPAQMKGLETNSLNPIHNTYKSDVFSTGVSLLSAACLCPIDEAYNYHSFQINESYILHKLKSLQYQYSDQLLSLLQQMLIMDEAKRPDFIQLSYLARQQIYNFNRYMESHNLSKSNVAALKPVVFEEDIKKNKQEFYDPYEYRTENNHLHSPILKQQLDHSQKYMHSIVLHKIESINSDFGRIDDTFKEEKLEKNIVYENKKSREKEINEINLNYLEQMNNRSEEISFLLKKYSSDQTNEENKSHHHRSPKENIEKALRNQSPNEKKIFKDAEINDSKHSPQSERIIQQKHVVKESFQNGSVYHGEKVNGQRCGHGKFYFTDGGIYDGQWLENQMHGFGRLYYSSNKVAYEGQWSYDKFSGRGTLFNENPKQLVGSFDHKNFFYVNEYWVKYDGDFVNDKKEGFGILLFSNGEKYTGNFKNDVPHGAGTFVQTNNQKIEGVWKNGKL